MGFGCCWGAIKYEMSFNSTDMAFFFSTGGGPGDDRELNLGGAISETEIVHSVNQNWAPDIPREVVGAIGTSGTWNMYFPFYVKNKNDSIAVTDVKLTVDHDVDSINVNMQMGVDPAGLNGSAQSIANQTTAPTGVTFQSPVTCTFFWGGVCYQSAITTWTLASTMNPGDYIALWVRLYGPKGVPSIPTIKFQIKVAFTRPA